MQRFHDLIRFISVFCFLSLAVISTAYATEDNCSVPNKYFVWMGHKHSSKNCQVYHNKMQNKWSSTGNCMFQIPINYQATTGDVKTVYAICYIYDHKTEISYADIKDADSRTVVATYPGRLNCWDALLGVRELKLVSSKKAICNIANDLKYDVNPSQYNRCENGLLALAREFGCWE